MNVADIFNKKNLADIVLIVSVIVSAILSALIFNYALKMTFISAPSFMIASSGFNADSKNTDLVKQTEYEESVSKILRSGIGASPSGSSTPFSGVNLREADFSGEGNPILKATFIGDSASFAVVQFNGIDKIILPGSRIGQAVLEEILRDRAVFRLESGEKYDEVITIGPLVMMKFVSLLTKKYGIKTVASMNPIMIDGTGMCGGCRLTVGGQTKFACVDGPEFDAHLIDFDEAISRGAMYRDFESREREKTCRLFGKEGV